MYIGKLFNTYDVNFPVENDFQIVTGLNGTGKTQTLLKLKEYYESQGENVLFFPAERVLTVTKDQAVEMETMLALLNGGSPFKKYGIDLENLDIDFAMQYQNYINSGFIQIVNFYCNILKQEKKPIVLLDLPERSIHIAIKRTFLNDLLKYCHPKKLIVVTHDPEIIGEHWNQTNEIIDFVQLG